MSIQDKIIYYKDSLEYFDDTMEKYKFLLEQGKKNNNFPEEYRKVDFLVPGCQAKVWLVPKLYNQKLNFYCDSDAFLTKGMIVILVDIYGSNKPIDILNADFDLVKTFKLNSLLTPGRTNGVYAMLKKLKDYAEVFSKK